MKDFQKIGGVAALIEAAAFLAGIFLLVTILIPAGFEVESTDPMQDVAFFVDNEVPVYLLDVLVYVVSSIAQVVLALALYQRMKNSAAAIVQTATGFGLFWAGVVLATGMIASIALTTIIDLYGEDPSQAATVWATVEIVLGGLGGGTELVGGIWVLLISWAALQTKGLPRLLNYFGLVIGAAGIITIIPPLTMMTAIFGLGMIVWFIWTGFIMLRGTQTATG